VSYHKQKIRVLAGSLNLLPPVDKIPDEDALELKNWRVDQAGQLRSRKGMMHLSGYLAGGICHTLYRRGDVRYAGIGARLYRNYDTEIFDGFDTDAGRPLGMANQGGFTWLMSRNHRKKDDGTTLSNWLIDAPTQPPVVTDGAQESKVVSEFEPSEAWSVIQPNGSKFLVHSEILHNVGTVSVSADNSEIVGSGTAWTAAMVGCQIRIFPPTITVISTVVEVTDSQHLRTTSPWPLDSASGYTYEIREEASGGADYSPTNYRSGPNSLYVECNPPGTWYVERTFAGVQDFGINGQQRDGDQFLMWLHASDPDAIEEVSVAVDVNTGNFNRDFYHVSFKPHAATPLWGSEISPVAYSWTQLLCLRRNGEYLSFDKDPDSGQWIEVQRKSERNNGFEREGNTAGKDWGTARAVRVQVRVSRACDVNFDRAEFVGGVRGQLDGDVRYYVTFDEVGDGLGRETNPTPGADITFKTKRAATITRPAVPTGAVRWHVYRVGSGLDTALRIASAGVTDTEVIDTGDNDKAQNDFNEMPLDNGPAPIASGLIGPYCGQLIAFSSTEHPNRYWWTAAGKPWAWPEENWDDLGSDDADGILAATIHGKRVTFYRQRSIWRVLGDVDTATAEQATDTVGLVGAGGVCAAGDLDYFVAADGIYVFNGDYAKKISWKIDPLFKGDRVTIGPGLFATPINQSAIGQCLLEFANGRLYFCYPEGSQFLPNQTLILEIESGRWTQYQIDPATSGTLGGFTALHYEGEGNQVQGAVFTLEYGAAIYELDGGPSSLLYTDDGSAIPVAWQSCYLDQGAPDNDKRYSDLVIEYRSPAALTVKLYFDKGQNALNPEVTLGTLDPTTKRVIFSPAGGLGVRALNAAVRIEGDVTAETVIEAVYLHFYVEPRRAKSFDTGIVNCGSPLVKQSDALEFLIEPEGPVGWGLHSDMPGGLLVLRTSGTIPPAAAPKTVRQLFASLVEGRRKRLVLYGGPFRLYEARLHQRVVGEYIDGAAGEVWDSPVIGIGG